MEPNLWTPEQGAALLGSKRPRVWTQEQDAELLQLRPLLSTSQIAARIGKSRGAVLSRYHRLQGNGAEYNRRRRAKKENERAARHAIKQQAVASAIYELRCNLAQGMDRTAAVKIARAAGADDKRIAEVVGVSHQRIAQIRLGRKPPPRPPKKRGRPQKPQIAVSPQRLAAIREVRAAIAAKSREGKVHIGGFFHPQVRESLRMVQAQINQTIDAAQANVTVQTLILRALNELFRGHDVPVVEDC